VTIRQQLPVYSPLTLRAVLAAASGLLGSGRGRLASVARLIHSAYAPAALRLTDSGTTALALAIRLAARGATRPVVALPAYACYDLATAADAVDARVVLYDLDPRTLGPDWPSFDAALAAAPSSIVMVHLYGIPVDMGEVSRRAAAAGVTVIEDAAQAVGARLDAATAGTLSPLAVLSFGRGKGRTGGRGGALLAHDAALAQDVEQAPLGGRGWAPGEYVRLKAQWLLARPAVYGLLTRLPLLGLGQTVYRQARPMQEMSAVAAAALAATWALESEETGIRRRHAAMLLDRVAGHPAFRAIEPPAAALPGYLRLPLLACEDLRAPFTRADAARLGIMPGYPLALADLAGFESRIVNRFGGFPGARRLAAGLGTLPTHSRLLMRDLADLGRWLDRSRA